MKANKIRLDQLRGKKRFFKISKFYLDTMSAEDKNKAIQEKLRMFRQTWFTLNT